MTNRISGNAEFIVFSTDLSPDDPTRIPLDWEIVLYHVPSGQTVRITDTGDRSFDDFFPSISRRGDVVAWTSDFDYAQNRPITSHNQIFAAKVPVGCSADASASNYLPDPTVEACCEWDDVPSPDDRGFPAAISLRGDPAEMAARAAFAGQGDGSSSSQSTSSIDDDDRAAWCEAYVTQVREDVACALSVPVDYVRAARGWRRDCRNWEEEGDIVVPLVLRENRFVGDRRLCLRLNGQYAAPGSSLWKGYLTKTMALGEDPPCDPRPSAREYS